jgi:hypothetical protein
MRRMMIILGQRSLPGSQVCAIIPEFRELASPPLCFSELPLAPQIRCPGSV